MKDMLTMNATEVRNNWSQVLDNVVREKPTFIKRTRDYIVLTNEDMLADVLEVYTFSAVQYVEDDGSITLSLNELDLVENAPTLTDAKKQLAQSILDYSSDFYEEFSYWSKAANRKSHVPYVLRALILNDVDKIRECISCQAGEN